MDSLDTQTTCQGSQKHTNGQCKVYATTDRAHTEIISIGELVNIKYVNMFTYKNKRGINNSILRTLDDG